MNYFKKFFVLTIILVLSLGLFGCQEGGNTYEEVMERGSISFSMSGGYPPFNYWNDAGELVGFDVEIAEEIANRLGVESKPVTTAWDGIIVGLQAGDYDGILGSMAITEERLESADFSNPYYYSGAQLVVRADSGITSWDDIDEGMEIAIVTGTTFADAVEELGATAVFYDGDDMTLRELDRGSVDGVITDFLVGIMAIEEHGYDFELVGEWLYAEELAVAFRKGDDDLREAVNQALEEMIADGTYQEISYRYFGEDISQPR